MSVRRILVLVVAVVGTAGCGRGAGGTAGFPPPPPPLVELPPGLDIAVDRVIDGDTIVVAGGHHIRLIGVDTAVI